ncbi:MAG: DUF192 domain-containing protein [Acidobacteria bacterium]|nr:DUF192 domain-containing protein [Acidobacteriota bacterium]
MKRLYALVTVAVVLAGAARLGSQYAQARGEVTFASGTRVSVEIADTDDKRQRGLMFRKELAPTDGMVFIFDEKGFYPFWMKNCFISLDMIWVDEAFKVVSIAPSVPPCKADPCPNYSPTADALYVVETVSGFAKQHGVKVGDTLVFKNIPKPRAR